MTDANEQAQWFGLTISSVLEPNLKLQERELSGIVRLGREVYIYVYWHRVYIMGTPLVHDICVTCVMCVLVPSTMVH